MQGNENASDTCCLCARSNWGQWGRGGGGGQAGTPCHNQHSPSTPTTGLRERGNDTSRSTGRSGQQNATTRRKSPVKKQQPDGMSHRGAGGPHVWLLRTQSVGCVVWPFAPLPVVVVVAGACGPWAPHPFLSVVSSVLPTSSCHRVSRAPLVESLHW